VDGTYIISRSSMSPTLQLFPSLEKPICLTLNTTV